MEFNDFITSIFKIVIIPLLGVLVYYFKIWISAKAEEIKSQTDNELYWKYISMLKDTITNTVVAVNQTYVDALKEQDAFDEAAQKEAFRRVYETVMNSLSSEAIIYLNEVITDLQTYIANLIESTVKQNKKD